MANFGNQIRKLDNLLDDVFKGIKKFEQETGDLIVPVPTLRFRPETGSVKKALKAIGEKVNGPDIAKKLADKINLVLKDAIKAKIWETIDGTDDIFDTGKLLDSQEVTISGSEIIVSYSEPYAALIHYGGYILPYGNPNADKVYIPPRPWVESTLKGETGTYSIEEEVKRAILDLLK